ncbi:hypothetical protein JTE90_027007 [Oedothorax gibbosus]|uniref:Uncharacterized protein n=1 Tax=Oedothorax gibbosus TaxID=931172 RepID=A0AAV6VC77_9ARAC|nr:hypothetical protein JTE90_027007 [Oedothorax gibbosus]
MSAIALCLVFTVISGIRGFNVDTKFPIEFKSKIGNYFGYSVALHRNRDGPLALIAAPRANSTVLSQISEPGVLYKCNIERNNDCEEVVLDKRGNTPTTNPNSRYSYHDKKDGMWLGVSLDVQQNSVRNDIVTCGHRWVNSLYSNHYLTNGVCYVINGDLDTNRISKLVPFVDQSRQAINPPGIYEYAFGQVGTSAAFSEDGKFLLLGAPGYYDWTGTVASYALNPEQAFQDYARPAIPAAAQDQNTSPESYIGYSVTSGKFYDDFENYVAMGAPRDGGLNGRVYIYKAVKSGEKRLVVHRRKEGVQLGEYFGASVLGVNVNDDAYTDLLVGAPLYSTNDGFDEGKVYVYLSNGMGLQAYTELYGSSASHARFGTALANVGDLNQDGYNDVAIGAPYENDHGVVYIYHGSRNGINVKYAQMISAMEINPSLSGFGIHISRGLDIDSNLYPDMLVGAYESSNALIFRTKPVIQLTAKISFSPKQINTNLTSCRFQGQDIACVNVTACLLYAGKHVPSHLDFQHEILIEPTGQANLVTPRGFFFKGDKTSSQVSQISRLHGGSDNCITEEMYLRKDVKDVITPVELLYRYSLVPPINENRVFNKSFPVIDSSSSTNVTSLVGFQTGCGSDDKCHSDLSIEYTVLEDISSPIVIGELTTLNLVVEIVNKGEPAFMSELFIYLPPDMPSKNQDICSSVTDDQGHAKNASLLCELGNPLLKSKKIIIKLDLTKIPTNKKQASIVFEASTASTETNPLDNRKVLPLTFKSLADISITGSPSHEQISFDGRTDDGKTSVLITHTYFVTNHGPSPVQIIDIMFRVPTSLERSGDVEFVVFRSLEIDSGIQSVSAECNDTYLDIKPIETKVKKDKDTIFSEDDLVIQDDNSSRTLIGVNHGISNLNFSDDTSVPYRTKRSNEMKSVRKKDLVINCDSAKCKSIQCSASPFLETRKFAKISITLEVNLSTLNEYLDPWYRIDFITTGEIALRLDKSGVELRNQQPDVMKVKTTIVSLAPPATEEVAQWIIFVSIGIGILLLLIILALLIKFGFFKREQKEKMEEMKSKGDYNPIEAESTAAEVEK